VVAVLVDQLEAARPVDAARDGQDVVGPQRDAPVPGGAGEVDWLGVLAAAQPAGRRDSPAGRTERSLVLAVLRGALLDLLATGDLDRTTAAVHHQLTTRV
jgi:hypothetical protein